MKNITIVDDEPIILELLGDALARPGRQLHSYTDPLKALDGLAEHGADLIVTDLDMPGMHGLELLKVCRVRFPNAKVVILTGRGGIREAVLAMKAGATDFFTKPLSLAELSANIGKLLDLQDAARAARETQAQALAGGRGRSMAQALQLADTVAGSDTTVLITGDTGVGKEVLADYIQRNSARSAQPYVKVNCVALPETLIESELFGHEKGAFTGASERRVGRFERANGGTLFLDEIGELPLSLQPKLLRVLQSREIERIGGEGQLKVDFRLLCATNQDLQALVKAGKFREDLYYRIAVFPIHVPALRERPQDIVTLAGEFLRRAEKAVGKGAMSLAPGAQAALVGYSWPGNVRELENVVERAAIMAGASVLDAKDFWWLTVQDQERAAASFQAVAAVAPSVAAVAAPVATEGPVPTNPLDAAERQALLATLQKNKWNFSRAAEELQMSRSTLYAKAARYGIKR